MLYSFLLYKGFDISILNYIGGSSLLMLILLYYASKVFQFCYLYRISLYCIAIITGLALYDSYFRIPISNLLILRLYTIISIIGIIYSIKFISNHEKHNLVNV